MYMTTYRNEYPRPQFVRERWMNLNGLWQFELDLGNSGEARKVYGKSSFEAQIIVPFCPESELSQVNYKDFIPACWYKRQFVLPKEWLKGRILLHFGAVNYLCKVWINGHLAGMHHGGYSSFCIDIRDYVIEGENSIAVYAQSDVRLGKQPSGKQSPEYESFGCFYTRTTGIWQTVWLEPVSEIYLDQIMLTPDVANQCLKVSAKLPKSMACTQLKAEAYYRGKAVGTASSFANGKQVEVILPLQEAHFWNPGEPELYNLSLKLEADGITIDAVESYFGLRSVEISGPNILINGKPVFQRLILDQGFYPKSVITAPSDEDIKADIDRSIAMGFNGARLHQKIFEARFLYWADHLGYIVWGEHGNWGLDISAGEGLKHFLPEWMEAVQRDYSSPALIGWCPFNETQRDSDLQVLKAVYNVTKWIDSTRPVIDTSGWMHSDETDIYDYMPV
jgi:beta-galactosidase/beta-glucuronidase